MAGPAVVLKQMPQLILALPRNVGAGYTAGCPTNCDGSE